MYKHIISFCKSQTISSSIFCLPPACLPKAKFQPLDQDVHLLLYICINAECEEECHISSKSMTRSNNELGPGAREDTETWAVEPWSCQWTMASYSDLSTGE